MYAFVCVLVFFGQFFKYKKLCVIVFKYMQCFRAFVRVSAFFLYACKDFPLCVFVSISACACAYKYVRYSF